MKSVLSALTVLSLVLVPTAAAAQISGSVGGGVAAPTGDLGDAYDTGLTVRAQAGVSLLVASVHGQVGWTRFPGKELTGGVDVEDIDFFHAGVGGRFGLGLFWVGLNAAYFSGDGDDGLGFFPEVGAGFGPIEAVADYRLDGDAHWLGLRAGLRF